MWIFYASMCLLLCLNSSIFGHVDIRKPPRIIEGPQRSVLFGSGLSSVILECRAEGIPDVTYEWMKDGKNLNLNLATIRKGADGTITIDSLKSTDEGFYQCFVTNQYGVAMSNVAHLREVSLNSSSSRTQSVHPMTVREGDPVCLQAIQPASHPKPVYGWDIALNADDNHPKELHLDDRVQITDDGNLCFAYTLLKDNLEGKIYQSTAFNPKARLKVSGAYTSLKVTQAVDGRIPNRRPSLEFNKETRQTAVVGETVSLRCFFSGYPLPTISWMIPGNKGLTERHIRNKNNSEFIISNISFSDEGEYVCIGSNSFGVSRNTVHLKVEAVPKFSGDVRGISDLNITEGQSVTFNCTTEATPEAEVTWFTNGKRIDLNVLPRRYSMSKDGKILKIRDVCRNCPDRDSRTDLIVIQCNASNVHGYAFASGYLNVLRKTIVTVYDELEQSVDLQQENLIKWKCTVESDPSTPVKVQWYRFYNYSRELVREEPPYITAKNGTLVIQITPNDTEKLAKYLGEYVCVGDNGYSKSNRSVRLNYQPPPPTTTECTEPCVQEYLLFIIPAGVAIFILVLLTIISVCCCLRRNGDNYNVDKRERRYGKDPVKELMTDGFHVYQRSDCRE